MNGIDDVLREITKIAGDCHRRMVNLETGLKNLDDTFEEKKQSFLDVVVNTQADMNNLKKEISDISSGKDVKIEAAIMAMGEKAQQTIDNAVALKTAAIMEQYGKTIDQLNKEYALKINELTERARKFQADFDTKRGDLIRTILTKKKEIREDLDTFRDEADISLGVARHSRFYKRQAAANHKMAKWWFYVTIALAILTILIPAYNWIFPLALDKEALPSLTARMVLVGMLFTATIWCGRMYKTLYNQALINEHRRLNASTMLSFMNIKIGEKAKEAIITQAALTMFQHASTGLIKENDGDRGSVNIYGTAHEAAQKIIGGSQ